MNLVIVGDSLLDIDIDGPAHRLSPDGPAPVIEVASTTSRAGGAALAARMLADDGEDVTLVTRIGTTEHGQSLRAQLRGVTLVASDTAATPVKARVRTSGHAVARLDLDVEPQAEMTVTAPMLEAIAGADAILVSDYGAGVTAAPLLRAALQKGARRVPLVWDPHPRGSAPVEGTTVVVPNAAEAASASDLSVDGSEAAVEAATRLVAKWKALAVAVTRGSEGAVFVEHGDDGLRHAVIRAAAVEANDPCGAGDRLAATVVSSLGAGHDTVTAVRHGVEAASAFLKAGGVSQALGRAGGADAVVEDAATLAARVRAQGGIVVATGGCFDILHAGHARTLAAARAMGDCLIVCLNSDDSVRRLKGEGRPIMGHSDREALLRALECVDAVVVFSEDSPVRAIEALKPHVWVKGGDYAERELEEAATLATWGGKVMVAPYVPGRSTTAFAAALSPAGARQLHPHDHSG